MVLQPVWLTSGSQQIEDVKVRRTRGGYRISYRIRSPRTGTTDMKRSIIYTVLPADGLPVIAEEGHGRHGSIVKTDTGVIDAGAFTGAPAP